MEGSSKTGRLKEATSTVVMVAVGAAAAIMGEIQEATEGPRREGRVLVRRRAILDMVDCLGWEVWKEDCLVVVCLRLLVDW